MSYNIFSAAKAKYVLILHFVFLFFLFLLQIHCTFELYITVGFLIVCVVKQTSWKVYFLLFPVTFNSFSGKKDKKKMLSECKTILSLDFLKRCFWWLCDAVLTPASVKCTSEAEILYQQLIKKRKKRGLVPEEKVHLLTNERWVREMNYCVVSVSTTSRCPPNSFPFYGENQHQAVEFLQ